ncbi:hypothetical protein H7J87_03205 [Mycolicibacterium wolinskyi]|uniref:Uncharacterized protein n=1 Tax=Mycolicibacterium wolinskyi TaxID=59750 RepID=A0A1X2FG98_9MYCO|nr:MULTISPECIES: hypothetical protein [Mycolicibacterium]MCV7284328.1 hypothetical protein [Mycolicibacterium wolinskyi]MCV7294164.1 hypothetical protein [Mycolicibacterium goodii]ORX17472.1 hypothetical protein AWC31_17375 [Mycolicibacterium wolinskyi]
MRPVGEIELSDLAALGRLAGHESLPYPFAHTRTPHRGSERRDSVEDSLANGDLAQFREWTDAYVAADIWLTGRVHHRDASIADGRILGFRGGDTGYLARQRSDDVVEIFAVPAEDLGAEGAGLVGLPTPGAHPRIVVPGYVGYFDGPADAAVAGDDSEGVGSVLTAVKRPAAPDHHTIADDEVAAIAIIQSRCQPAREWGVDWTKPLVACLHIEGDGSYVYAPDFSHAVPVAESDLAGRVDRLISADIALLAHLRGMDF